MVKGENYGDVLGKGINSPGSGERGRTGSRGTAAESGEDYWRWVQ